MATRMPVAALLALAVAALALAGCSPAAPARPAAAEGTAAAAPAGRSPERAVAIGDSIAFGKGVQPDEAWPALVARQRGWRLTDLAVSGSGFVKPGWNGTTYRQQVAEAVRLRPGVILIAATRNDRDQSPAAVAASASALLGALREALPHTRIVGVAAVWGSGAPPASVATVDSIVRAAVTGVGGTFLDIGLPLRGRPDLVQADGIHPDAAGQRAVARAVEDRLTPAGATS